MKNPIIAEKLKEYRKKRGFTVKYVASCFAERNNVVAEKTIYGWENGQTQPSADNLMFLCDLYEIDNILETFGYTAKKESEPPFVVTVFEQEMICRYRKSILAYREAICKLLDLKRRE